MSSSLDRVWLGSWVQGEHLDETALDRYRRTFECHPARLTVLRRFLHGDLAAQLRVFLGQEVEYRVVHGLHGRVNSHEVDEHTWLEAEEGDRFYRYRVIDKVRPEHRLSRNVIAFFRLRRALSDDRFVRLFEQIAGIPLGALHVNVHTMKTGDFLSPHSDAVGHRRLAYVLFLSPDWSAASGGVLHVVANQEHSCGGTWRLEPDDNSLVIFDVTARTDHFVSRIEAAAADRTRLTIGGWIEDRGPA